MRILHTADWHLGDRLRRIDRTADLRRGVERIAAHCDEHRVEVLLVAGDLFSELSRPDHLRDSIEHLQQVFTPFLARGGTIVAITGNHDNEIFCRTLCTAMSLAAPRSLAGGAEPAGRLYLAFEPCLLRLADPAGQLVQFGLMPYPTPRHYLADGAPAYRSLQEKNQLLQAAYRQQMHRLLQPADFDPRLPTVLAAHIHVTGAVLSNLLPLADQEGLALAPTDLPAEVAYVALGHIHRPQCLRDRPSIRYCGSLDRLDLGERNDPKSVVLLDIGPDGLRGEPVSLPLEPTPIYEVTITQPRDELPRLTEMYPDHDRALVRLQVTYQAGTDNLEAILRQLDDIFPRWYDRSWSEVGELSPRRTDHAEPTPQQSFRETVLGYLDRELADNPDRDELLDRAQALLEDDA
jgi:exonuclease SbcD